MDSISVQMFQLSILFFFFRKYLSELLHFQIKNSIYFFFSLKIIHSIAAYKQQIYRDVI